jgi:hypothetical protein
MAAQAVYRDLPDLTLLSSPILLVPDKIWLAGAADCRRFPLLALWSTFTMARSTVKLDSILGMQGLQPAR